MIRRTFWKFLTQLFNHRCCLCLSSVFLEEAGEQTEASTCLILSSSLPCDSFHANGNSCQLPGFHIWILYHHFAVSTSFSGSSSLLLFYCCLPPGLPASWETQGYLYPCCFFVSVSKKCFVSQSITCIWVWKVTYPMLKQSLRVKHSRATWLLRNPTNSSVE